MNRTNSDWEKELAETPMGMGGFSEKTMKKIKERVSMPSAKKRRLQPMIAGFLAVALLVSGWLLQDPVTRWLGYDPFVHQAKGPDWDKEDMQLKVQYYDKSSFMSEFGLPFVIQHPNVQFEIPEPPTSSEFTEYKKWILENEPDVLQVPLFLIDDLANEGIIKPLDEWIKRDNYPMDDFHEPVIRTIREAGAGTLYGLSPYFETMALFYNKTLFDQFGLKPPTDQMTWKEILQLAARFNGKDAEGMPIYGLTTPWDPSPFQLIQNVGETDGLRLVSSGDLRPSIDSPAWRGIWDEVLEGYQDGWLSSESRPSSDGNILMTELYKADPFMTGRAAMALKPSYYRKDVLAAEKEIGFQDEWGIATQPVSASHPDQAAQFSVTWIYAVNVNSSRAEAAWALLQYMAGPEKAKQDIDAGYSPLSSRLPATTDASGHGDDVFYKLNVDSSSVISQNEFNYKSSNIPFINALQKAGNAEVRAVIAGNHKVEQAMKDLQSRVAEIVETAQREATSRKEGSLK